MPKSTEMMNEWTSLNLSNFTTSVSTQNLLPEQSGGFDGSAEAEVKQILKIGAVRRDGKEVFKETRYTNYNQIKVLNY